MRIMQFGRTVCIVWPLLALATPCVGQSHAVEKVVYAFADFPHGANPYAPLFLAGDGSLYGTTNAGGTSGVGVVFRLDAKGKYKVLYSFKGGTDGANPYSGVTLDAAGNIYGTTYIGGANNAGVVYKVDPSGHETLLYSFTGGADGANPYAGVILDSGGNLYGTTHQGGSASLGVAYEVSASGQETVLHTFAGMPDGATPYGGLTFGPSGNLYGTTFRGGANNTGSVYELSPSGQLTVLHSFVNQNGGGNGGNGSYSGVVLDSAGNIYGTTTIGVFKLTPGGAYTPLLIFGGYGNPTELRAGVVRDSAGNLYGTSENGGPDGTGIVYKLDPQGKITGLYHYPGRSVDNAPNVFINAGVILDSEGNVYGTTSYGGVEGMIYKIDPARHETTLYNFQGAPGGTRPDAGVRRDSAGNLYGATQTGGAADWGVVYKVDPSGHETALYTFTGGADGAFPESALVVDPQGNVYGTALEGGSASGTSGYGTVFKLDSTGQFTVLHTFTGGVDGGYPGDLILDSAGNLYGTAWYGPSGGGVVYEIDAAGNYSIHYAFTGGADGATPNCLIQGPGGSLYGTAGAGGTHNGGVIFKLDPSGQETALYSFTGGLDGGGPIVSRGTRTGTSMARRAAPGPRGTGWPSNWMPQATTVCCTALRAKPTGGSL